MSILRHGSKPLWRPSGKKMDNGKRFKKDGVGTTSNIKDMSKKFNRPVEEFLDRLDGRIEWTCEHGVGHTVFAPKSMGKAGFIHGCDGCCKHIREVDAKIDEGRKDPSKVCKCSTCILFGECPNFEKPFDRIHELELAGKRLTEVNDVNCMSGQVEDIKSLQKLVEMLANRIKELESCSNCAHYSYDSDACEESCDKIQQKGKDFYSKEHNGCKEWKAIPQPLTIQPKPMIPLWKVFEILDYEAATEPYIFQGEKALEQLQKCMANGKLIMVSPNRVKQRLVS